MVLPVPSLPELQRLFPAKDLREGQLFLMDKPLGWTSANVVSKCKYHIRHRLGYRNLKVGHAGTLDPLATGLLVVCVGRATRLAELFTGQDKVYEAQYTLGGITPSYDLETPVTPHGPYQHITRDEIARVLGSMVGEQLQRPPLFSAKRVDGKRAYQEARRGRDVEIPPVPITVHSYDLLDYAPPHLTVRIACSKGTYIRSMAHDTGLALGCGAYLSALRRTESGPFSVDSALSVQQFEELINGIACHPERFDPREH